MMQKPEWWEWVDLDTPAGTPWILREDAPEEVIKKFDEWKRKDEENKKEGLYA